MPVSAARVYKVHEVDPQNTTQGIACQNNQVHNLHQDFQEGNPCRNLHNSPGLDNQTNPDRNIPGITDIPLRQVLYKRMWYGRKFSIHKTDVSKLKIRYCHVVDFLVSEISNMSFLSNSPVSQLFFPSGEHPNNVY